MDLHSKMTMYVTSTMTSPVTKTAKTSKLQFLVQCLSVYLPKGSFNNYVDRILPFFDPLPLRGQFLYPERGQKQTFFGPPPLILST